MSADLLDSSFFEIEDGNTYWRNAFFQLHRTSGPAIMWHTGDVEWWLNGKYIPVDSQQEFEQYLRLLAFV